MKKIFMQLNRGVVAIILLICATSLYADAHAQTASPITQARQTDNLEPSPPVTEPQKLSNVTAPVTANSKPNTAGQLANLLGGLALILVLILGLSWFVKRFSQGGFMQNSAFKVVASMPLGTRERIMLVSVGDKQLLLGVTATQISTLHVFDNPVVTGDKEPGSDFSQKLMAILQQKNISQPGNSSPRDRQS